MLQEPMMEKLLAMRLHGMADALKTQEQDPGARELSFAVSSSSATRPPSAAPDSGRRGNTGIAIVGLDRTHSATSCAA
jgi:hypothetical protein